MTRRAVIPLLAVGLLLTAASLFLVGRDLAFVREEAEAEVVAFAETSAVAIRFAPANEIEPYVTGLLNHPAIAMVTVYSSDGKRTTRRRPPAAEETFLARVAPSLDQPIVGCRGVGSTTVCVEGDRSYFGRRVSALLIPHLILLAASAVLLVIAILLGRGSNRERIDELTRVVRGAAEESNYSVRVSEAKGPTAELASAVNRLLEQMQQRDLILRRRTTELESANRELEAFSFSVSHDLRSPLASVDGFSQALADTQSDRLDESGREYLQWIQDATQQMKNLVAGLLQMSRISRSELNRGPVDLSQIAESIAQSLRLRDAARSVEFRIEPGMAAEGDERLLHAVLENLMSNAYKFTGKKDHAIITAGSKTEDGRATYFVKDNGAGFDSTQAARMFTPFQRLHTSSEFEGTGIGLATVKRIIERHGGAIWAESRVGEGATFLFTLAEPPVRRERINAKELTTV